MWFWYNGKFGWGFFVGSKHSRGGVRVRGRVHGITRARTGRAGRGRRVWVSCGVAGGRGGTAIGARQMWLAFIIGTRRSGVLLWHQCHPERLSDGNKKLWWWDCTVSIEFPLATNFISTPFPFLHNKDAVSKLCISFLFLVFALLYRRNGCASWAIFFSCKKSGNKAAVILMIWIFEHCKTWLASLFDKKRFRILTGCFV